jgi:hypothetical protein
MNYPLQVKYRFILAAIDNARHLETAERTRLFIEFDVITSHLGDVTTSHLRGMCLCCSDVVVCVCAVRK